MIIAVYTNAAGSTPELFGPFDNYALADAWVQQRRQMAWKGEEWSLTSVTRPQDAGTMAAGPPDSAWPEGFVPTTTVVG